MKILITANSHDFYDSTGEIVAIEESADRFTVLIDNSKAETSVQEGQFKVLERI